MQLNALDKAVSYKDKVYQEIKRAIINQELEPGKPLNERVLAEELGISRTPVREALRLLENEGWVRTEPWKGTYIINLTQEDIEEVFQLRMVLEVMVIEMVVVQIDDDTLAKIDEFYHIQSKLGEEFKAYEFIEFDRNFHMYLAERAGNRRTVQIMKNLNDIMCWIGVKAVQTKKRYRQSLDEHEAIIKALKARDAVGAKQAMMHHMNMTRDAVYQHWKAE